MTTTPITIDRTALTAHPHPGVWINVVPGFSVSPTTSNPSRVLSKTMPMLKFLCRSNVGEVIRVGARSIDSHSGRLSGSAERRFKVSLVTFTR